MSYCRLSVVAYAAASAQSASIIPSFPLHARRAASISAACALASSLGGHDARAIAITTSAGSDDPSWDMSGSVLRPNWPPAHHAGAAAATPLLSMAIARLVDAMFLIFML